MNTSKGVKSNKAVATTNTTALDTLNAVRSKIQNIKLIADAPARTHGKFKYNPTGIPETTINTVTNVADLLNILGFLMEKENRYNAAADAIGLNEYPVFTWCGYPVADWKHDITVRIAVINHHKNLGVLEMAEKELTTFLTQDDRLQMLIDKIGGLLG